MDLVSQVHREGEMPHRGYMMADRDRDDPDHPAPRGHPHKTGFGHPAIPRDYRGCGLQRREITAAESGGVSGHKEALAGHAANDLRRPGEIQETVLAGDRRGLFYGGG